MVTGHHSVRALQSWRVHPLPEDAVSSLFSVLSATPFLAIDALFAKQQASALAGSLLLDVEAANCTGH